MISEIKVSLRKVGSVFNFVLAKAEWHFSSSVYFYPGIPQRNGRHSWW